jgi:hypothetical protein
MEPTQTGVRCHFAASLGEGVGRMVLQFIFFIVNRFPWMAGRFGPMA